MVECVFRQHCGVSGGCAADQQSHGGWRLSEERECRSLHSQDNCACLSAFETALYRYMRMDLMSELGVRSQLTPVSWSAEGGLVILLGGLRECS
jgi:hypothetical protein